MTGEAVSFLDFKLNMERFGYFEDVYFDFSYRPIKTFEGEIIGILVVCTETTAKINALEQVIASEQRFRSAIHMTCRAYKE